MIESTTKKYWKGLEEKDPTADFQALQQREFAEDLPLEEVLASASDSPSAMPRRDFLKTLGFGVGAVAIAACNKAPVHKAVPYLIKPEEVTPGMPNYYATALPDGYSVLVKTREGRPIKIEGNPKCPVSEGGVDALGHASVLDLYDHTKLKEPVLKGRATIWEDLDAYVKAGLAEAKDAGQAIVLLTHTIHSPSTQAVIADFIKAYPSAKHLVYDAVSYSAIIHANQNSFKKAVIPAYHFDQAALIVSFGADFLSTWLSPVEFSKQYTKKRSAAYLKANKKMSRHIQFETTLSLTGSNADLRIPLKPSQEGLAIIGLYNALAKLAQLPGSKIVDIETPEFVGNVIARTAAELWANKEVSLVVAGSNDVRIQTMVNAINSLLDNYGKTIDLDNPSLLRAGNESDVFTLIPDMQAGKVGAVIFYEANPLYHFPQYQVFADALAKVKLKVSLADRADETAKLCDAIAPDSHYLESWNDAQPKKGLYMLTQPTIAPIYNTRQASASLLTWTGNNTPYLVYIKNIWQTSILPLKGGFLLYKSWDDALRSGFVQLPQKPAQSYKFEQELVHLCQTILQNSKPAPFGSMELVVHENTGIRGGRGSGNPLLQELPDPISKVTWDNYVAIAPRDAKSLGIQDADLIKIATPHYAIVLPAVLQPGQAIGTVAIALGYGRTDIGKTGNGVGKNAYPFVSSVNGSLQYQAIVTLTKEPGRYTLARTQTHNSIEGRDIIRETTLANYVKDQSAGSQPHHDLSGLAEKDAQGKPIKNAQGRYKLYSLWDDHERKGHHWGMAIDLNACTGCGACVVSCNLENNIPVVGKDEVHRRREMHWIRVDRYYSEVQKGTEDYVEGEDNVEVVHQPMLCQHCDRAPCETVCPVLATMHSSEGLNQMVYNRCFGTRYCANNCPYKVRRFNWFNYVDNDKFDYHMNNDLGKMVLNPDVTVRSRGVMEKCSLCVQRIQAGKLEAKMGNRSLKDGDIQTACSASCPADAIVFGDINDPNSRVSALLKNDRTYYVLEELNVQPGMGYLTKVRNKEQETIKQGH